MKRVCLDSHILIWGIKKESSVGQENMIQRAVNFLELLDKEKTDIIIPSPVIGELLMRVPQTEHAKVIPFFEKLFKVVSYDLNAASCFADIWQKQKQNINVIKDKLNIGREELKVDCQIVACAIVNKAECIYSYDEGLKSFANGFIEIKEMPDIAKQLQLY